MASAETFDNQPCATCQKPTTSRCSRCKKVYYCCRECQLKDWKTQHKKQCRSQSQPKAKAKAKAKATAKKTGSTSGWDPFQQMQVKCSLSPFRNNVILQLKISKVKYRTICNNFLHIECRYSSKYFGDNSHVTKMSRTINGSKCWIPSVDSDNDEETTEKASKCSLYVLLDSYPFPYKVKLSIHVCNELNTHQLTKKFVFRKKIPFNTYYVFEKNDQIAYRMDNTSNFVYSGEVIKGNCDSDNDDDDDDSDGDANDENNDHDEIDANELNNNINNNSSNRALEIEIKPRSYNIKMHKKFVKDESNDRLYNSNILSKNGTIFKDIGQVVAPLVKDHKVIQLCTMNNYFDSILALVLHYDPQLRVPTIVQQADIKPTDNVSSGSALHPNSSQLQLLCQDNDDNGDNNENSDNSDGDGKSDDVVVDDDDLDLSNLQNMYSILCDMIGIYNDSTYDKNERGYRYLLYDPQNFDRKKYKYDKWYDNYYISQRIGSIILKYIIPENMKNRLVCAQCCSSKIYGPMTPWQRHIKFVLKYDVDQTRNIIKQYGIIMRILYKSNTFCDMCSVLMHWSDYQFVCINHHDICLRCMNKQRLKHKYLTSLLENQIQHELHIDCIKIIVSFVIGHFLDFEYQHDS